MTRNIITLTVPETQRLAKIISKNENNMYVTGMFFLEHSSYGHLFHDFVRMNPSLPNHLLSQTIAWINSVKGSLRVSLNELSTMLLENATELTDSEKLFLGNLN